MNALHRFKMPLPHGEPFPLAETEPPLPPAVRAPEPALTEPFAPIAAAREIACQGCGRCCRYEASLAPRPESPEFLKTGDLWLGFFLDPDTETLHCVAACSEACLQKVLRG